MRSSLNARLSKLTNAKAPEGTRLYAIGDIHGRADLLEQIIGLIESDNRERNESPATLIFVGDYVDRGPASMGVVDTLIKKLPNGFSPLFLKGNHEDLLLSFLSEPVSALNWLYNGGDATLRSYGVAQDVIQRAFWGGPAGLEEAGDEFRALLPQEHLCFYEALRLSYRAGDYFFVHGGVRPGVPLDRQSEEDLLWIRDEFLNCPDDFGAVVVHGHTPVRAPQDLHNRIGIDTYACHTGKLTAVGLQGSQRWFLST
jgi:serine/threonine protein phosphatase 1